MGSLPLFSPEIQPAVFTVTQLTALIRETLEAGLDEVWVSGEVSNLRIPPSGHCYFTLKDARSQIAAVLFQPRASALLFQLENGMEVVCRGRVGLYAARGDLQLYVDTVEPRGVGALQIQFEQLKERLQREGLFDPGRKRPIPFLPKAIGIVTSLKGAAVRDMLRVLGDRFPGAPVVIRPVQVQGEKASEEIAEGIRDLNAFGGVEVIIVGRGGGSVEDLWAFNEERVARAMEASAVPIVSAVGHEIDFTIADFVADVRAPTPTAAAQMVVPERAKLVIEVSQLAERMDHALAQCLRRAGRTIFDLSRRLRNPEQALREIQMGADDLALRLSQALRWRVRSLGQAWQRWKERLCLQNPEAWLREHDLKLHEKAHALLAAMRERIERDQTKTAQAAVRLDSLSPLAVLGRGYCIVRKTPEGWVVVEGASLKRADEVEITFAKGRARCSVEESS